MKAADPQLLCRGEPADLSAWVLDRRLLTSVGWICLAGFVYGFAMGAWRDPWMGLYVALKLPVLLLTTSVVTAVINGLLAQIWGLHVPLHRSLRIVLTSFATASIILASFAPLVFFVQWNVPSAAESNAYVGHHVLALTHVLAIAFAGVVANVKMHHLLAEWLPNRSRAKRILFAWLAVNMFVGCQLSWNLRPFFGSPGSPVELVREDAFEGSFYESVLNMTLNLTRREPQTHEDPDHERKDPRAHPHESR